MAQSTPTPQIQLQINSNTYLGRFLRYLHAERLPVIDAKIKNLQDIIATLDGTGSGGGASIDLFDETKTYGQGSLVIYKDDNSKFGLYQANADLSPGAFAPERFDVIGLKIDDDNTTTFTTWSSDKINDFIDGLYNDLLGRQQNTEHDVADFQSRMVTAEDNIWDLQQDVLDLQGDIAGIETSIDNLVNDGTTSSSTTWSSTKIKDVTKMYRSVATLAERDAIPLADRSPGMKVAVVETAITYTLKVIQGFNSYNQATKDSFLSNNGNWVTAEPIFYKNSSNGIFRWIESGTNAISTGSATASGSFAISLSPNATASGYLSVATGFRTVASGEYSFVGGADVAGSAGTVLASGKSSFNYSSINIANKGAKADYSAILGGLNNNIQATALRSVVLGGSGIDASQPDTVYVPKLNVGGISIITANSTEGRILMYNGSAFVASDLMRTCTYTEAQELIINEKVIPGTFYKITNRPNQGTGTSGEIVICGATNKSFASNGFFITKVPDYANIPEWHSGLTEAELYVDPNTGETLVIHQGKTWRYLFDDISSEPGNDPASWGLNDEFGDYLTGNTIEEVDLVEYRFDVDWIDRRQDKRGNDVKYTYFYEQYYNGYGGNTLDFFKWGDDKVYSNTFNETWVNLMNTRASYIYANIADYSYIADNTWVNTSFSNNTINGGSISGNQSTDSYIYGNVGFGYIEGNILSDNSNISGNTLGKSASISGCELQNSNISGNDLGASATIGSCNLTQAQIEVNKLDTLSVILSNTLAIGTLINFNRLGVRARLESKTLSTSSQNIAERIIDGVNYYPVYSSNANAIAAGLIPGTHYRTSTGQMMIVY